MQIAVKLSVLSPSPPVYFRVMSVEVERKFVCDSHVLDKLKDIGGMFLFPTRFLMPEGMLRFIISTLLAVFAVLVKFKTYCRFDVLPEIVNTNSVAFWVQGESGSCAPKQSLGVGG